MFFWAETIWPAKPGNVLPGPLQENSAHPAPELCCSKRGLWTSSISWPGRPLEHGILSLPQTYWLRISRFQVSPAHSTVWEALVSRPSSIILCLPPPQGQTAREDQGVWPPGAPPPPGCALSTWTLEPLLPAPVQASLLGAMSQPDKWSRYSCLWDGKRAAWTWTWRLGMLLLEQQIPQGTKRVRARGGGRAGGGPGARVGPSLCCPAFWLGAQCPKSQSARF